MDYIVKILKSIDITLKIQGLIKLEEEENEEKIKEIESLNENVTIQ